MKGVKDLVSVSPHVLRIGCERLGSEDGTIEMDEEQAPGLAVLLLDDRSAGGAGAAPPQAEH
jgi:hypothetical protein